MLKKAVMDYLLLSALASAVLLSFVLVGPIDGDDLAPSEWMAIGSVFILVCALGILSSTDIARFARAKEKYSPRGEGGTRPGPVRVGHHPDCESFKDHIIVTKGKIFCCGCLSLALGSAIAIVLMVLLMFFSGISPLSGPPLFALGLSFVALAFVETGIHCRRGAHMLVNILLPVGFLSITVGVSVATGNMALGLVAVLISILLLDTRITISRWKAY